MICDQDLSGNNILVDEDHCFSGIIDSECVHTVPLWLGCQIPKFLRSPAKHQLPTNRTDFDEEDNKDDYWQRVEKQEKTQLRKFYLEEMQRVCPEWIHVHKTGSVKAHLDFMVHLVPLGATVVFERWL